MEPLPERPEASALTGVEHASCPLCGGANACIAASRGDFSERCWCESVVVDAALRARLPAASRACLCAACVAAGEQR